MDDKISLLLPLIPALPLAAAVALRGVRPAPAAALQPCPGHRLPARVRSWAAASCCGKWGTRSGHNRPRRPRTPPTAAFERIVTLWTWADVPAAYRYAGPPGEPSPRAVSRPFRIDIQLRVDSLTAMMLTMVTFISTLIAVFSVGYMHGDRGYWRFFSYLGAVRVLDDDAGFRQQFRAAVRLLGSRRRLQLSADRLLVREARGGCGGIQGVPGQSQSATRGLPSRCFSFGRRTAR